MPGIVGRRPGVPVPVGRARLEGEPVPPVLDPPAVDGEQPPRVLQDVRHEKGSGLRKDSSLGETFSAQKAGLPAYAEGGEDTIALRRLEESDFAPAEDEGVSVMTGGIDQGAETGVPQKVEYQLRTCCPEHPHGGYVEGIGQGGPCRDGTPVGQVEISRGLAGEGEGGVGQEA